MQVRCHNVDHFPRRCRVLPDCFPALTAAGGAATCSFRTFLPDGVMVAQATLTRLVMVRIHVGQPFDAALAMLGPCSWQAISVARAASNALSEVEGLSC